MRGKPAIELTVGFLAAFCAPPFSARNKKGRRQQLHAVARPRRAETTTRLHDQVERDFARRRDPLQPKCGSSHKILSAALCDGVATRFIRRNSSRGRSKNRPITKEYRAWRRAPPRSSSVTRRSRNRVGPRGTDHESGSVLSHAPGVADSSRAARRSGQTTAFPRERRPRDGRFSSLYSSQAIEEGPSFRHSAGSAVAPPPVLINAFRIKLKTTSPSVGQT